MSNHLSTSARPLAADNNMIMCLVIGRDHIPFLQYLTDIFQRDRMQLKLQNQFKDEYKNKFIQQILGKSG